MKNLKDLMGKKQISLLNFTRVILLFNCLVFSPLFSSNEALQDLGNRLALSPPTEEDYAPIIEAIQNELHALKLHNFEKAYFFYTSKSFRKATSLQEFILFIKNNPVLANNKSITLKEMQIDRGIAYYTGIAVGNDGSSRKVKIQLSQEEGRWKIIGIQFQ